MQFPLPINKNKNIGRYSKEDMNLAREFSKKLYKEFADFLKGVIIFGSAARKESHGKGDIDILIIVDDITMNMSREVVEAYRIITKKTVAMVSPRLHVMSLKLTTFWEYVKAGDPVAINILRDGVAVIDSGFFDPLQALLLQGRIRPTQESMWTYYSRAPRTLHNSKWHQLQATLDLYWAVIDASHAALMKVGEIPPSPEHAAELLEEKLVNKKLLEKKYSHTMKRFYTLMKQITHREIKDISGKQYDTYFKEAEEFVNRIKKFIEEK